MHMGSHHLIPNVFSALKTGLPNWFLSVVNTTTSHHFSINFTGSQSINVLFSRFSPLYTNVLTIPLLHISPVSSRFTNLEDLAFALVQTVHSWQFQRCIPLLGIVLFTHMLRAFGTVSLIKFVPRSHLQFSRNISKLSCSMTDCFDCFPLSVPLFICLLYSFL